MAVSQRPSPHLAILVACLLCPALLAFGCDPTEAPSTVNDLGLDEGWTHRVRLAYPEATATRFDSAAPLYDPTRIAYVEAAGESGLPTLFIAESNAWRIRRHTVMHVDPVVLGEGELVATATPDVDGAAWVPMPLSRESYDDEFAELMVADRQLLVFNGARGELWALAHGTPDAVQLGVGRGGLAPQAGVDLSDLDAVSVTALGLTTAPDSGAEELLLASTTQIFRANLSARLRGEPAPLIHVAGSGAMGTLAGTGPARLAPLELLRPCSMTALRGHLYVTEIGQGLVLHVHDFRERDAIVEVVAGGGDSLDVPAADPLDLFLTLSPGLGLEVHEDGGRHRLDLVVNSVAASLELTLDGDERVAERTRFELTNTGAQRVGGLARIGESLVVSDRRYGTVQATTAGALTPGERLIGPDGEVSPLVDHPMRPGMVLLHRPWDGDRDLLVFTDVANGHSFVMPEVIPEPVPLAFPPEGADFAAPTETALLPAEAGFLPKVLTRDRFSVTIRNALFTDGKGQPQRISGAGTASTDGLEAPFGSWELTRLPHLWSTTAGILIYRPDLGVMLELDEVPTAAVIPTQFAGGLRLRRLPIDDDIGRQLLDLDTLRAHTSSDGLHAFTVSPAARGDMIYIAAASSMTGTVAGAALRGVAGRRVVGGGALPLQAGRPATDVGLTGVGSGVVVGSELWFSHGRATGRLWAVDVTGTLRTLSAAPEVGEPPPSSQDLALLEDVAFEGPVLLDSAPCLPPGVLLVRGEWATWMINGSAAEVEVAGRPLPRGGIAELLPSAVVGFACDGDALLAARRTSEGVDLTDLASGRSAALPDTTTSVASRSGELLIAWTDDGTPTLSLAPLADLSASTSLAAQPLTGLGLPAVDGISLRDAALADNAVSFTGAEDTALYVFAPGQVLRVRAPFNFGSALQVVWSGSPLTARPEAVGIWYGRPRPALLVAVQGRLYGFEPPATASDRGRFFRIAGGGRRSGPGHEATDTAIGHIHAVTAAVDGTVWLRWDGYLGRIEDGRLVAVAGGGTAGPSDARSPLELRLLDAGAFGSSLAISPGGEVTLADPARGMILAFAPKGGGAR